jgi:hypothetical protein
MSKITRAKRAGDMAYVVECLRSKYEALSSNPVPQKKVTFDGVWGGGTHEIQGAVGEVQNLQMAKGNPHSTCS